MNKPQSWLSPRQTHHPAPTARKPEPTRWIDFLTVLTLLILIPGCMMAGGPPPGNPTSGYSIWGYLGHSSTQAAANETVVLVNASTGESVGQTASDFAGKYLFSGLKPGDYRLQAGSVGVDVKLGGENQRVDIDLSRADGKMDYAAGAAAPSEPTGGGEPQPGSGEPQPGSGGASGADPALAQQLQGIYWGYSGSTETKIGLCPGGRYQDYSESSYSGQFTDGLGNQTGAWGAGGQQQGSGSWSVRGDLQQGTIDVTYADGTQAAIQYRAGAEAGCFYFDGRQLCRTGACE
jgi:hypothetical protein